MDGFVLSGAGIGHGDHTVQLGVIAVGVIFAGNHFGGQASRHEDVVRRVAVLGVIFAGSFFGGQASQHEDVVRGVAVLGVIFARSFFVG